MSATCDSTVPFHDREKTEGSRNIKSSVFSGKYCFEPSMGHSTSGTSDMIFGSHVLYVTTGGMTRDESAAALEIYIEKAQKILASQGEKPCRCSYILNFPFKQDGSTFGFCYAWITDERVYNLIIGKNSDGTARKDLIPDPDWKKPEKAESGESLSWADMYDDEEEDCEHPMISKPAPSSIGILHLLYDSKTLINKRDSLASVLGLRPEQLSEEQLNRIQKTFAVQVKPSFVKPVASKFHPNVLSSLNVPSWISEKEVYAHMKPFSTSSHLRFPEIHFEGSTDGGASRNVTVTYDSSTDDALFALQMQMKFDLHRRDQDGNIISTHQMFLRQSIRNNPKYGGEQKNGRSYGRGVHQNAKRASSESNARPRRQNRPG